MRSDRRLLDASYLFVKPWHVCHPLVTQDDRFHFLHVEKVVETADAGPNELWKDVVLEGRDIAAEPRQKGLEVNKGVRRHVCTALECMVLAHLAILQGLLSQLRADTVLGCTDVPGRRKPHPSSV